MIVIVCWLPVGIAQLIHQLGNDPLSQPAYIEVLQAFAYLQGFFDALVYGRSVNMIGMLFRRCKKDSSFNDHKGSLAMGNIDQGGSHKADIGFTADEDQENSLTDSLVISDNVNSS